jgi:hypothetical protein
MQGIFVFNYCAAMQCTSRNSLQDCRFKLLSTYTRSALIPISQPMSPSLGPADMKMRVTILHSCPLALQRGKDYVPLVWREPGFEEMKNAISSSLEASEQTRNMPIAIEMKHASNSSFDAVFGQKVAPDILILSGQELELLDPQQQPQEETFSVIVEDDVGAAASLYCPRLKDLKPEQYPKVIIVHGNFVSSFSSPFCTSPAAFLLQEGTSVQYFYLIWSILAAIP